MVSIAPAPIYMSAATLKIGTNNYENSVSAAALKPTTPKAKFKGIGGGQYAAAGTPDWELEINLAQDFASATTLSRYLLANVGTVVALELYPKAAANGYSANVLIEPGQIGGTVDELLEAGVTLMVIGQPVALP